MLLMIITLQSGKGGSGKTTLSIHLAQGFANRGIKTLLVDGDPQGSARDWVAAREVGLDFGFAAFDRPTIHRDIKAIASEFEITVIDGAPRSADLARSAIAASDLVLIPIHPSAFDVWAAAETVALIREINVYKTVEAAFVINRKIVNAAITKDVVAALATYEFPVLVAQISQRIALSEVVNRGATVLDYKSQTTWAARQEISFLVSELLGNINEEK